MSDSATLKRVALWRSRRGLLELDLILVPFVEQKFETLTNHERNQYLELLELDDVVLLSWIRRSAPTDPRFEEIVEKVIQHITTPSNRNST